MLYTRQILILLVSLYTVRVLLNVLGVEDYGIYNVIGGIVTFFSFLSGSMASATQRFFSFSLGEENFEKLKNVFTVNWIIYGVIAIFALILLETVGLWFVTEHLKLPPVRFESALWVYHFSVLTLIATIFTTPFIAIIIAHEDMQLYAYASIVEAVLKLGIIFLLIYIPWCKLELYGVLLFSVSLINAVIYIIICTRKYMECQFRKIYWNKDLLCEIIGFTGWTLFGHLTTVIRKQAVTILLNQAFNPVVVAARAVATNIANRINLFSVNFNTGLYPPIIKFYATNDKNEMFSLIFNGSKITFFLMWVFALPLFLEMNVILKVWLKNPPVEAVLFTRLALIEVLINSISLPLATAARAPGKMKVYELTLGSIQIAIFIISWLFLEMGYAAYSVFVIAIIANMIMFIVRLIIVRALISLSVKRFLYSVFLPVSLMILVSAIPSYAVYSIMPEELGYTIISVFFYMIFTAVSMYIFGLDKIWRKKVQHIFLNQISKLTRAS